MFDKFLRWFMCSFVVNYEYEEWIRKGNGVNRKWNADQNYKAFLLEKGYDKEV